MAIGLVKNTRKPLYCSFCGKEQGDVGYLVAGPTVFICNECVEMCREIGQEMLSTNVTVLPLPIDLSEQLRQSVERFKQMPREQQQELLKAQRKSWVIGEMMLAHPKMTRDEAEAVYDRVAI